MIRHPSNRLERIKLKYKYEKDDTSSVRRPRLEHQEGIPDGLDPVEVPAEEERD